MNKLLEQNNFNYIVSLFEKEQIPVRAEDIRGYDIFIPLIEKLAIDRAMFFFKMDGIRNKYNPKYTVVLSCSKNYCVEFTKHCWRIDCEQIHYGIVYVISEYAKEHW